MGEREGGRENVLRGGQRREVVGKAALSVLSPPLPLELLVLWRWALALSLDLACNGLLGEQRDFPGLSIRLE